MIHFHLRTFPHFAAQCSIGPQYCSFCETSEPALVNTREDIVDTLLGRVCDTGAQHVTDVLQYLGHLVQLDRAIAIDVVQC